MQLEEIATKEDLLNLRNEIRKLITELCIRQRVVNNLSFEGARMYLGEMPEQTLREKTANHEIAVHKLGKRCCYAIRDLDEYMRVNRIPSNREIMDNVKMIGSR